MMKTSKYIVFSVAAALVVGAVIAVNSRAAEDAAPERPLAGKMRERVKEKLNLSEEQAAKIKSELKAEKSNITSLLTRLHDARTELRAEIQKPGASETSVREAAAKLSVVEADLAVERLKLHNKIVPLLTTEQRAKLAEFQAVLDRIVERVIDNVDAKLSE
jgi:Spy/CpxP family protein refolding chaperone